MSIVVTTPTGHVGSRVVQLLLQAGVRPTVLVRDAARLEPGVREHCTVVEGDQDDVEAVLRATARAETLYWVNPPSLHDDPVAGHARFGAVAAAAVAENAVARVVFQSSVGAEAREGFGDIDGLARTEELLDATGAHTTHLRCGYFFTNLLLDLESVRAGVLSTTLPVDHRMPWVDPRDIGEVAAARLLAGDWTGRHTQGVHGPEDLSFAEVARIVGAAVGRPLTAQQVEESEVAEALRGLGFTDAQVEGVLGMSRGQRGFVPENPRDALTTTPTRLGAWAWSVLRPALEQ
ncbi:NmrA family NAD(P)-binding protein [Kocuria turfanensis]|uniref:Nucleotide-diphosphate-sugar epimerase n=1 Tax=Kocuria turfanensis TaxID=388357 RepID=A0A512IG84_9MICC|nr:NAD(P)H-binding protein [Kocuria turfanensis]GEO96723.1 nucleotide-diphosphate-sugar epimerase [Kocuria turfanensis]